MNSLRLPVCTAFALLAAACTAIPRAADEFPQPPLTQIFEFPPPAFPPSPTPAPRMKPILPSDMQEARDFFLITKIALTAGDSGLIVERVLYPIQTRINGRPQTVASPAEFERNFPDIFDSRFRETILAAQEEDLVLTTAGLHAAGGALVFDLFCTDAACTRADFRITQINN